MIFLLVPAAFIRGRRLFEEGIYSKEAFIRGRRLFEGGVYWNNFGIRFPLEPLVNGPYMLVSVISL